MIIQIIESQINFISKTTDLYDSQYCSKENEDRSLQSYHIIRELVQTKKPFELEYGFKSHCTSINERLSKLEYCLQYRPKVQRNIFPPFGNEFLPLSKTISLAGFPIIYPLKRKYLCDYDPICLMSSGLMFDEIIMDIIRNNKL